MRTQRTTRSLLGLIFLFFMSGLVSFSKTRFLSILADAQGLQEVSPRMILPQQSWDEKSLVKTQTQFGLKLFSTLVNTHQSQNVFISPTSITLMLSMLYNGSTGRTKQEIAHVLGIQGIKIDALNRANEALESDLDNHSPQVKLTMANSLWARQGFSFRYQFLKDNRDYYQSQITNLNFSNGEASGIINRWVKENTQGKISEIIHQIKDEDVLLLTDTAYFQGNWQVKFDEKLTHNQTFYVLGKHPKNYSFMSRRGQYRYLETSQLQGVSLPYGEGRFSLYLFLPKSNHNLQDLFQNLTVTQWNHLLSKFREKRGLLELPCFTLNAEMDLTNALQNLGLSSMFNQSQAKFSALTSHPAYVNRIQHQTLLEINEKGTQPPLVNSMNIKATSVVRSSQQFKMIVNRPFFCFIKDNETGAILFMGKIVEP